MESAAVDAVKVTLAWLEGAAADNPPRRAAAQVFFSFAKD